MLPSKLRRKLSGIYWAKEVAARLKAQKRLESGIRRENQITCGCFTR
jgi:hypothetical protein